MLSEMLNTGPWNRLPLKIQWLKQEYFEEFPVNKPPPVHMPIAYGLLRKAKRTKQSLEEEITEMHDDEKICLFCNNKKPNTIKVSSIST